MGKKTIYVTEPFLPPLEEFVPYLEQIWESRRVTNNGPFHRQFEVELASYLGVPYVSLFANGTIALLTALQTMELTGEVITTAYSFVATSHSLFWNGIKPIFVDIDPVSCNLDPEKIEAAITPHTTGILPVHCYGNPCDVDRIQRIADRYGLKVIYDAAHGFGVRYRGESLFNHGDLSVLSFHATKVFNTFEGGAIVSFDDETKRRIDFLKNFGFKNEVTVVSPGINGKMNEIQAAFGLLQLKYVDWVIARRKSIDERYRKRVANIDGIECMPVPDQTDRNYSYFPVRVKESYSLSRDALYQKLRDHQIHARRYFYPLISDCRVYERLPSAKQSNLRVAHEVAKEILCLPIYPSLKDWEVDSVIDILQSIE